MEAIKMVKFKYFLLLPLLFLNFVAMTQNITNVTAIQEQNNIIVSYNLETKESCKINLYVSEGKGVWKGPLKQVKGDVGYSNLNGNNKITWDVLKEFQTLKGSDISFKVEAADLLKVGIQYKGGILVFIKDGHGLIATNEDLGFSDWTNAKIECDNLVLNGYDDWYLPNKNELKLLYLNKDKIGHLTENGYWSSSEIVDYRAWKMYFSNGEEFIHNKENRCYFRAIRAF